MRRIAVRKSFDSSRASGDADHVAGFSVIVMRILFLGGTRFMGRALAIRLVEHGHRVTVLSRNKSGAPDGAEFRLVERSSGIPPDVLTSDFDVVIDTTGYTEQAVSSTLTAFPKSRYIFISSTWVVRDLGTRADQLADQVQADPSSPTVTAQYLAGKRGAERVVHQQHCAGSSSQIVRLPIMWGAGDHTHRKDFYSSRISDGNPVILIDGGENLAQVVWVDDVAAALALFVEAGSDITDPIIEALPQTASSVAEIIELTSPVGTGTLKAVSIDSTALERTLPEYLDAEPLWREREVAPTAHNLFTLVGHQPTPISTWLPRLPFMGDSSPADQGLREREIALIRKMGLQNT